MAGWAAAIAAIGSLAGGAINQFGGKKKKGKKINQGNALYNQMMIEAMTGLGISIPPEMLLRASPLGQLRTLGPNGRSQIRDLITQGRANGLSIDEITQQISQWGVSDNRLARNARRQANHPDRDIPDARGRLGRKLRNNQYGDLRGLIQAEMDYMDRFGPDSTNAADLRGLQEESLAGRRGAQSSIARIQGDFVAPSQADILAQSGTIEEALRGQIARERSDSQNMIFEQMNAMGINPGARLGRLDEWQAQQNLEAQPNALARALQLMSGQQNLQGNALALLRGSLDSGTGAAQNLLNFQSSQNSAAAQQALALAAMNRDNGIGPGVNNAFNAAAQGIFASNHRQDDAPGEPTPRNTGGY